MTSFRLGKNRKEKGIWRFENGKIYFSRRAEQRFFFALTVIMLLAGILYKFGLLG
jgi:hypothetical protein